MEGSFIDQDTQTEVIVPPPEPTGPASGRGRKAPRKALGPRKSREKRPYKKLTDKQLKDRVTELYKKITFLEEKVMQLKTRCQGHEKEQALR